MPTENNKKILAIGTTSVRALEAMTDALRLEVAGSGLTAQRGRMNVISSNLANVHTTRGANGQPYVRQDPVFQAQQVAPAAFDPISFHSGWSYCASQSAASSHWSSFLLLPST